MQRLRTQEEIADKLSTIYTTNEQEISNEAFRLLVLDALRFYGAATEVCQEFTESRTIHKIASKTSKSWAEDFLIEKHGCDRYWAHSATNLITHRNLPNVEAGSMDDFINLEFYKKYLELKSCKEG